MEPITARDRRIMRQAGGRIVRHVATGLLGHAYPWQDVPEGYTVEEDHSRPDGTLRV